MLGLLPSVWDGLGGRTQQRRKSTGESKSFCNVENLYERECCTEISLLPCIHVRSDQSESLVQENEEKKEAEDSKKVTGVVTNQDYGTNTDEGSPEEATEQKDEGRSGPTVTWKLNMVLAVISCFFAMALTGWGSIQSGGTPANPDVGEVSMWMIIASQWVVMTLYLWTLVAPRLFPDRDFS